MRYMIRYKKIRPREVIQWGPDSGNITLREEEGLAKGLALGRGRQQRYCTILHFLYVWPRLLCELVKAMLDQSLGQGLDVDTFLFVLKMSSLCVS